MTAAPALKLFRLKDVAAATGYSVDTVRRAITRSTDPAQFPPPLSAGKDSKGYFVLEADVDEWLNAIKAMYPA